MNLIGQGYPIPLGTHESGHGIPFARTWLKIRQFTILRPMKCDGSFSENFWERFACSLERVTEIDTFSSHGTKLCECEVWECFNYFASFRELV